jgi:Circularly permutated YpsA SLOG family
MALGLCNLARHPPWRLVSEGRKAEDGVIPERYLLKETPTSSYLQRTEWNVRDSEWKSAPRCVPTGARSESVLISGLASSSIVPPRIALAKFAAQASTHFLCSPMTPGGKLQEQLHPLRNQALLDFALDLNHSERWLGSGRPDILEIAMASH